MAETGSNWNIRRDVLANDLARTAGYQALELSHIRNEFITDFHVGRDEHSQGDLSVSLVDLSHPEAAQFMDDYPELMRVYEFTELSTNNGLRNFFINRYGPYASTPKHRDIYAGAKATSAIGLLGEAEVELEDVLDGTCIAQLHPGDEWWLNDTVPLNERPLHVVRNILGIVRVAIANG